MANVTIPQISHLRPALVPRGPVADLTIPKPVILLPAFEKDESPTDSASSLHEVDSESSSVLTNGPQCDPPKVSLSRLWMSHIGAALTLFLATTDATIVSTSLPTIASDLGANQNEYTWVAVAYMLTQTAFQPLYGRISDLVGRKTVLYSSMAIFVAGSMLCGAAKTITWLIAARAFAGIGGGGIVSSVWVITSEIVEVKDRAKWSQALSVTWSCSAVAGPLLGGFFSTRMSWRWAFYLNLPLCSVGFVVLYWSLHKLRLGQCESASWRTFLQRFDFLGLILFMSGSSTIVVGFSFASSNGWAAPSTILLITLGLNILVFGAFYEVRTKRDALFPVTVFKDLTAVATLFVTFLHNVAFTAGTFYLALYFQTVNGSTPLQAGMLLLPYSLGSSLASMPVAWFIGYRQERTRDMSGQKIVISIGLIISASGFGLMNLLHESSPSSVKTVCPLIAGLGLGMLFHAPYQVFTRVLHPEELAAGTSAFFLVRFTGATIGLSVAGAIFDAKSSRVLQDYTLQGSIASIDFSKLRDIQPLALRLDVLRVVSSSIQTVWMVCCPCLGAAFVMSLLLRNLPVTVSDHPTVATCNQGNISATSSEVKV